VNEFPARGTKKSELPDPSKKTPALAAKKKNPGPVPVPGHQLRMLAGSRFYPQMDRARKCK